MPLWGFCAGTLPRMCLHMGMRFAGARGDMRLVGTLWLKKAAVTAGLHS